MKIKIHEIASVEFDDAIEWYESQHEGLGQRFKKNVLDQIKKIRKNPSWFLQESKNIYKAYIPKYPYKIIFTIEENLIIIWAFAHLHRRPYYWINRKK